MHYHTYLNTIVSVCVIFFVDTHTVLWYGKEKKKKVGQLCVCAFHTLTFHVVGLERVTDVQRGHA